MTAPLDMTASFDGDGSPREPAASLYARRVPSPIGELFVVSDGTAITEIHFESHHGDAPPNCAEVGVGAVELLDRAAEQLAEYFAGERRDFDLPVAPRGTEFQRRAWAQLLEIPYGETLTYGEQARRIDAPTASRAVGAANGANPIPIVIPCHRVVGANGSLTGYAGGVDVKRALLDLERGQLSL